MAKFIKLTGALTGEPSYIIPDVIEQICSPSSRIDGVARVWAPAIKSIVTTRTSEHYVTETPEQILSLIEEAGKP